MKHKLSRHYFSSRALLPKQEKASTYFIKITLYNAVTQLIGRGVASLFLKGGQALTHGGGSRSYKGNLKSGGLRPPDPPRNIFCLQSLC